MFSIYYLWNLLYLLLWHWEFPGKKQKAIKWALSSHQPPCQLSLPVICLFGSNWCNIQPQLWAAMVRDWSQRGCSISNMPATLFNDECQERVLCSLSLSLSLHMCVCLECSYACLLRKIMNIVVLHNNEAINNKCLKRLESYSYIILISFSSAVICFRSQFSYR